MHWETMSLKPMSLPPPEMTRASIVAAPYAAFTWSICGALPAFHCGVRMPPSLFEPSGFMSAVMTAPEQAKLRNVTDPEYGLFVFSRLPAL